MKRLILVVITVLLAACSKMTRTDVIDRLIDNGYSRNTANFYEKQEDEFIVRIGYRTTIAGYLESLKNYISPGPIALLDIGGNNSFNYHFNEDAMLYSIVCMNGFQAASSELMYNFSSEEFIIGVDSCNFDTTKQDEYIEQFKLRKEKIMQIVSDLELDKKKLNLLGK